jgi:hypothetical protein
MRRDDRDVQSVCLHSSCGRISVVCFSCSDMFNAIVLNTNATEICFFRVIKYNEGYSCFKVKSLIHLSSQNLVLLPLLSWNHPKYRKHSLTFIRPLQNWESPSFFCTCAIVYAFKYFFLSIFCHSPSSFINLKSHLLSKHQFCISILRILNSPSYFGWHII